MLFDFDPQLRWVDIYGHRDELHRVCGFTKEQCSNVRSTNLCLRTPCHCNARFREPHWLIGRVWRPRLTNDFAAYNQQLGPVSRDTVMKLLTQSERTMTMQGVQCPVTRGFWAPTVDTMFVCSNIRRVLMQLSGLEQEQKSASGRTQSTNTTTTSSITTTTTTTTTTTSTNNHPNSFSIPTVEQKHTPHLSTATQNDPPATTSCTSSTIGDSISSTAQLLPRTQPYCVADVGCGHGFLLQYAYFVLASVGVVPSVGTGIRSTQTQQDCPMPSNGDTNTQQLKGAMMCTGSTDPQQIECKSGSHPDISTTPHSKMSSATVPCSNVSNARLSSSQSPVSVQLMGIDAYKPAIDHASSWGLLAVNACNDDDNSTHNACNDKVNSTHNACNDDVNNTHNVCNDDVNRSSTTAPCSTQSEHTASQSTLSLTPSHATSPTPYYRKTSRKGVSTCWMVGDASILAESGRQDFVVSNPPYIPTVNELLDMGEWRYSQAKTCTNTTFDERSSSQECFDCNCVSHQCTKTSCSGYDKSLSTTQHNVLNVPDGVYPHFERLERLICHHLDTKTRTHTTECKESDSKTCWFGGLAMLEWLVRHRSCYLRPPCTGKSAVRRTTFTHDGVNKCDIGTQEAKQKTCASSTRTPHPNTQDSNRTTPRLDKNAPVSDSQSAEITLHTAFAEQAVNVGGWRAQSRLWFVCSSSTLMQVVGWLKDMDMKPLHDTALCDIHGTNGVTKHSGPRTKTTDRASERSEPDTHTRTPTPNSPAAQCKGNFSPPTAAGSAVSARLGWQNGASWSVVDCRLVPFKVFNIINNKQWLDALLRAGFVYQCGNDDARRTGYSLWHRIYLLECTTPQTHTL